MKHTDGVMACSTIWPTAGVPAALTTPIPPTIIFPNAIPKWGAESLHVKQHVVLLNFGDYRQVY